MKHKKNRQGTSSGLYTSNGGVTTIGTSSSSAIDVGRPPGASRGDTEDNDFSCLTDAEFDQGVLEALHTLDLDNQDKNDNGLTMFDGFEDTIDRDDCETTTAISDDWGVSQRPRIS